MIKYVAAYLGAGLTFAAIDFVWLTTMTNRLYKPVIGPIMADKPDMKAAVAFYLISIAGTVFLAIAPALKEGNWTRAAINGAVLGFVAYATYDLTNWATLKDWPWKLSLIDMAWGTLVSTASAAGGKAALLLGGQGVTGQLRLAGGGLELPRARATQRMTSLYGSKPVLVVNDNEINSVKSFFQQVVSTISVCSHGDIADPSCVVSSEPLKVVM